MTIEEFINDIRLDNFAESTIAAYARVLRKAPFELPGDVRAVRAYLTERRQTVCNATLICEIRAFKAYSRWWADQCDEQDPLVKLKYPKQTESLPGRIADDEDIHKVLLHLRTKTTAQRIAWQAEQKAKGKVKPRLSRWRIRDAALVNTFRFTGMRRSEVARMMVADIDFEDRQIAVPKSKNGRGRYVRLHPTLAQALRLWLNYRANNGIDAPELWIGNRGPLKDGSLSQILERISIEAGLEHPLRSHQFRRRLALKWVTDGGTDDTLMLVAGWKSPTMPARYRAEARDELARVHFDRIFAVDEVASKVSPTAKLRRRDGTPLTISRQRTG